MKLRFYTIAIIATAFTINTVHIAQAQTTTKTKKTTKEKTTYTKASKWTLRAEGYLPKPLVASSNATKNGFHYPKNFGFAVGAERNLRNRKNARVYQYGMIGFYNEVYFERVATLATGLGFNRKIYKTIGTNFEIDGAYHRATSSHLIAVLEGGNWVSKIDKSTITNRFVFSIGGNFEYNFTKRQSNAFPLIVTLGYNASVLTPYDAKLNVPLNLYHQPRLGLKWKL